MKKRGDEVVIQILKHGRVRVNCATIDRDCGDMVVIFVDLHSKRAKSGGSYDIAGVPGIDFYSDENTLHVDELAHSNYTTILFPEYIGWNVYTLENPAKYTAKVVLAKNEIEK